MFNKCCDESVDSFLTAEIFLQQDGNRVDINLHEDDKLEFLGSRTLKPRIRRERGRDEIKREEETARRKEFDREARDAGFS